MFNLLRKMATLSGPKMNRLNLEKSPYLLQHASNPVDWYPWGEEAFEEARKKNKMIFLSVGYSTCHWCHVMEKESFENVDTAKIMNDNFINIKVDREERPDVDKVYMSFVTQLTGSGGWPMSVWLTPDLKPIYGGTYYPPDDRYKGMHPSFTSVLNSVASKWNDNPDMLINYGEKIITGLKKNSRLSVSDGEVHLDQAIVNCAMQLASSYEPQYGGFSSSPKFPQPSNLNFIFAYKALYPESDDAEETFKMAVHTLLMMGKGGIHDHVAQGFARYSTDKQWQVPHFEKMLYDQAQLVHAYLDAYLMTRKECFADLARDIMTYVTRDLSHPEGGFYSAEDADSLPTYVSSEKIEGAFCVWEFKEIQELLQDKIENTDITLADMFTHHYSVSEKGNVDSKKDPHENFTNKNVLIINGSFEETAEEFSIDEETCKIALKKACQILYEARSKRPRPHLDDKMLTAWNGMMLSATARAGAILGDKDYIQRAIKNANFIKKYLLKDGKLIRTAYKTEDGGVSLGSEIEAFSDDYAWLIRGLIELYYATLDSEWLQWAENLQEKQHDLFWDNENGGFFLSKQSDSRILIRLKEDQDGAEPSINSVSAGNLVKLSRLLNCTDLEKKADSIFKLFSHKLSKLPISLPEMVLSLMLYSNPAEQIIFLGNKDSIELKQMLSAVHKSAFNPNRIILLADSNEDSILYKKHENLSLYKPKEDGSPVAFVCKDFSCSLPAETVEELTETMTKNANIS